MTTCTFEYWNGSSYVSFYNYSDATTCDHSVTFTPVTTTKLRFNNVGGSGNPNFREIEVISVKKEFNVDVAIGTLVSPENPNCSGNRSLTLTLANPGKLIRDSALIAGNIRTLNFGVVPLPNVMFSGSISPRGTSAPITIYSYSYAVGDTIELWVKLPNGQSDSNSVNDSLIVVMRNPIPNKYYSVGPDTLNDDFRTVAEAVHFIDSIKGLCDSVIIEISDTTYVGQYSLSDITGTSLTKPLIFRPKPGNTGKVYLSYNGQTTNSNHLFSLSNSAYIIFDNIHFDTFDGTSTNNSSAIHLEDKSGNTYFRNCSFNNRTTTSMGDGNTIIYNSNDFNGSLLVENCTFIGGSKAIAIVGGSNHIVAHSFFYDQYLHSISFSGGEGLTLHNNTSASRSGLLNAGNTPAAMGISFYLSNMTKDLILTNNIVKTSNSQWPRMGICIENYDSKGLNCNISNNTVNIGQAWSALIYSGIYITKTRGLRMAHNSVALAANNKDNAALFIEGGTNNEIYNNSLAIYVNGYCILNAGAGSITGSNNNNLYSQSNNLAKFGGTDIANLSGWQAASSLDANSISYNPNYYSLIASDLHVCNTRLYQAGTPIASVTHDIDGDLRDPNMPCIGADEFAPVSNYSLGADYGLCPGDSTVLIGGSGNFGETAIWSTNDTGQFLTVTTPGQFAITLINQCGVSVDTIEIIQPQAVALGGNITLCAGATKTLDATITNGTSYMWSNGKSQSSLTVTAPSNNTATSGSFAVTATDVWGCVSSDQVDFTYRFRALMSIKDTIVCEDGSISLFSGVSSSAGRSFTWSGYNASSGDNTDGVIIIDIQLDNLDTVIVTVNDNGCITSDTTYVEKVFRPKAEVGFTQNGMAVFFDTNNSTGNTHFFDFGENGVTSTFSNPSYLYRAPGLKEIMYVNSNRCGSDTTYVEFLPVVLSISENNANTAVSLYPNPNRGRFFIETLNENAETMYIDIMDISGKKLFSTSFEGNSGLMKEEVVLGDIPAGMYLIQLKLNERVETKRFTVN
jgi:hypothetical protein